MAVAFEERYKSISPAEFFYKNKELAGFSNPARALYQSVRELVENALDATDAHGILPDIEVLIEREERRPYAYRITVKDNGIGIPGDVIPEAFGRVLFSSKYILRQSRGLFGLGAKMVVLYSQLTVGEPAEIVSATIGSRNIYAYRLMIDIKENRPLVLYRSVMPNKTGWHGTVVRVTIEGDWGKARQKILEYFRRTAIIAPYANLVLKTPDNELRIYRRATTKLPPPPRETKPHPHGIDLEMIKSMIAETRYETLVKFLANEFQGIGAITAERLAKSCGLDPNVDPRRLSPTELELLVKSLREFKEARKPRADHLSPIGAELIRIGLAEILKPEFVEAVTRDPVVYEGHPMIVEVGVAFGGSIQPSEEPVLLRFANKIPLLYDEKSDVSWKVVKENIDWGYYGIEFPAPLVALVHICGTKIPYKGVGKESIAEVPVIEEEIENGIRYVLRLLSKYLAKKQKEEEYLKKAYTIIKYVPEVARALAAFVKRNAPSLGVEELESRLFELVKSKYANYLKGVNSPRDVVLSIE